MLLQIPITSDSLSDMNNNSSILVILILIIMVSHPFNFIDTNNCFKILILVGNEAYFILLIKLIYGFKNNSLFNYLFQKKFYYK